MPTSVRGTCICGATAFHVDLPFSTFQYCHCSRCRKNSGSAHAANIFVPVEQFFWERGEQQVRRFELPEAKWWCSGFCSRCGSSMPWLTRNGKMMIVPAGALDEDPGVEPTRNVYYASRAPWYAPASELEVFDTHPGASK